MITETHKHTEKLREIYASEFNVVSLQLPPMEPSQYLRKEDCAGLFNIWLVVQQDGRKYWYESAITDRFLNELNSPGAAEHLCNSVAEAIRLSP